MDKGKRGASAPQLCQHKITDIVLYSLYTDRYYYSTRDIFIPLESAVVTKVSFLYQNFSLFTRSGEKKTLTNCVSL